MKKTFIIIFILPLVIGFGHNKAIKKDLTASEKVVTGPMNIHWGTKHNTLRGVTISWYSSEPEDSIRWGYSREYESGKYPGKRSDYGVDIVLSGHTHSYIRTKPLNLNISDTSAVNEYGSKAEQGRLAFVLGGLGGRNSRPSEDWFTAKAYSGLHYIKFKIIKKTLHFDTYTHLGNIVDSMTIYSDAVE